MNEADIGQRRQRRREMEEQRREKEEQQRCEKHVRWQGIRITQFGYVNYLILTLASGALIAGTSPLTESDKCSTILSSSALYQWALFFLMISVMTGIACAFCRLHDFRDTAEITKLLCDRDGDDSGKDIAKLRCATHIFGKVSWGLVWCQITSLGISIPLFAVSTFLYLK